MVDRVTAVLLRVASELLNVKIEDLDVHGDMHECGFDPVSLASLVDQLNREYALDEVARRAGVRAADPHPAAGAPQRAATDALRPGPIPGHRIRFGVCLSHLA